MAGPNGWGEWAKHVLSELERLNACYEKLDERIQTMHTDIVTLKIKAGVWGLVGGIIPVLVVIGIKYL